ncbi:MAG TPA: 5'-3' exonuclease H3TH domain-containing protein [Candidatus Xenobia bacterium]
MMLLVDYSSMLYRAYHSTPKTVAWHGVYGCLNMLTRIVLDRRPSGLVMGVDDDWRPRFRTDALPTYKAHRVSDEPDPVTPHEILGRQILAACGVPVIGCSGYEAEDIIATLAKGPGPFEILSGDRDLFALVHDPAIAVLYPLKGTSDLLRVDEAEVTRRYGIPGRAYGDFALLRGDPSDGLPGVPGIGEKTASQLIARYGSLDALLAATDLAPTVARKLQAAAHYLAAARQVVLPRTDVPLAPDVNTTLMPPSDALLDLAVQHSLETPVTRFMNALRG